MLDLPPRVWVTEEGFLIRDTSELGRVGTMIVIGLASMAEDRSPAVIGTERPFRDLAAMAARVSV